METVVVAIQRSGEAEACALVAPRVVAAPLEVRLQLDLAGGAADRQVADDLKILQDVTHDTLADEMHFGMTRRIEEVCGSEMVVAHLLPSVDRVDVDGHVDLRVVQVFIVDNDGAFDLAEAAADVVDHEMTN